jgi:hypothetical protein
MRRANCVRPEWVEDARWWLPHDVKVKDGSSFVVRRSSPLEDRVGADERELVEVRRRIATCRWKRMS